MTKVTRDVAIFRVSGSESDVGKAVVAIEACDYPWGRLRPAIAAHDVDVIPVRFRVPENVSWRAYYAGPRKGITIYPDVSGLQGLVLHEAAHAVDGLTLPDDARDELHRLMHGGGDLPSDCMEWNVGKGGAHEHRAAEGFAWHFVFAFAREFHGSPTYGGHRIGDVDGFRQIVLDHLPPEEPPMATFPDVPADRWSYESVEKAAAAGVLEGDAEGNFRPTRPVTREQLAVILDRAGLLEVSP